MDSEGSINPYSSAQMFAGNSSRLDHLAEVQLSPKGSDHSSEMSLQFSLLGGKRFSAAEFSGKRPQQKPSKRPAH